MNGNGTRAYHKQRHYSRSRLTSLFQLGEECTFGSAPTPVELGPLPGAAPEHFKLGYDFTRQLFSVTPLAELCLDDTAIQTRVECSAPAYISDVRGSFCLAIDPFGPEIWLSEPAGAKAKLIDARVAFNPAGRTANGLDAVNLVFPPDRVTCIFGKSGTGKSTLLKLLLGTRAPDHGVVSIDGCAPDDPRLRRKIAFLPQRYSIPQELTARELFDLVSSGRNVSLDEPINGIPMLHLVCSLAALPIDDDFLDRRMGWLSGGQYRRLSLAVTLLMAHLTLLLVDEPSAGLDPVNEKRMLASLKRISRHGVTVIAVTHSTRALAYADYAVVLGAPQRAQSRVTLACPARQLDEAALLSALESTDQRIEPY